MRVVSLLGRAAAVALLAGAAASCGQKGGVPGGSGDGARPAAASSSNGVIGKWTLTEGDPASCYSPIQFTDTTQTLVLKGEVGTTQVTYSATPEKVYVIGNTGIPGAVGYKILGADKIQLDAAYPCTYQRAG